MTLRWLSSIVGLLLGSGPTTVPRSIGAFVVNSVDAVFACRFAAHVCEKISVVVPTWINRYTAICIEMMSGAIVISASIVHVFPRNIFSGSIVGVRSASEFVSQASARTGFAASQIAGKYLSYLSAIALAFPITAAIGWSNNCPTAKSLGGEVEG